MDKMFLPFYKLFVALFIYYLTMDALAKFGLTWDDVVVQSELVSGKVASKDLDENGKLTLSGANAGTTTIYIYFWGVKSATFTVTVT